MQLRFFESCPSPTTRGWVYFFRDEVGYVKIGWTERDPAERKRDLDTGHAKPLEVLHAEPSDDPRGLERRLHARFRRHRVRPDGEWFFPVPEILHFLAALKTGHVPEWEAVQAEARRLHRAA